MNPVRKWLRENNLFGANEFLELQLPRRRILKFLSAVGIGSSVFPKAARANAPSKFQEKEQQAPVGEEGNRITAEEKSAFWEWLQSEGIPTYTGYVVDDARTVKLGHWKRLGVMGAAIYLSGDGGQMAGYICELDHGQQTTPEKHLYEEHVLVLSGSGETRVWYKGAEKVTARWKEGTLFSVPLNTWHEHINTGAQAARLVAVTDAPLMIDLFRNSDFIFNNEFKFTERFNSQSDYFTGQPNKIVPPQEHRHSYSITNLVPDVHTVNLYPAGHGVGQGVGTVDHHFEMAGDTLDAHVEQWRVGVYERCHRHGAGDNVLILRGQGYSLMWPSTVGTKPFAGGHGSQVIRVDWHPGTLFVPPLGWFHEHFNTSATPARFVKLDGWENRVYPLTSKQTFNQTAINIEYKEEDPKIREIYEAELKKNGVPSQMPSIDQPGGGKHHH